MTKPERLSKKKRKKKAISHEPVQSEQACSSHGKEHESSPVAAEGTSNAASKTKAAKNVKSKTSPSLGSSEEERTQTNASLHPASSNAKKPVQKHKKGKKSKKSLSPPTTPAVSTENDSSMPNGQEPETLQMQRNKTLQASFGSPSHRRRIAKIDEPNDAARKAKPRSCTVGSCDRARNLSRQNTNSRARPTNDLSGPYANNDPSSHRRTSGGRGHGVTPHRPASAMALQAPNTAAGRMGGRSGNNSGPGQHREKSRKTVSMRQIPARQIDKGHAILPERSPPSCTDSVPLRRQELPPRSQSSNLESMRRNALLEERPGMRQSSILKIKGQSQNALVPRREHAVCMQAAVKESSSTGAVGSPGVTTSKEQAVRPGLGEKRESLVDMTLRKWGPSTHTMLTEHTDDPYDNDPTWKRVLRFLLFLPPQPDESPDERNIRIFVWCTLMLDFIAAVVSITTYDGVTKCCGVPIFSLTIADVDWSKAIRITTYVYLILIFAEVIPVVRQGLPLNLINPMVGFCITFAMFFDDRIPEAVSMWILEAFAVGFELMVYRTQIKMYHNRYGELDKINEDLMEHKSRRKFMGNSTHSGPSSMGSANSESSDCPEEEDTRDMENPKSLAQGSSFKLKELRLLRERRILRARQGNDRQQLRYHFLGAVINCSLVCISLILIIVIARSGGLCVKDDERPIVFDRNQLDRCGQCKGTSGTCEICTGGHKQCYYPYY